MIRNRTSFAPLACYISCICQIQLCMKRSIRPLQTFECIARLIQFRIRIEFQGSISKFGYNSSRRQQVYFPNLGQALFWHERIQYVFSGIRTKSKGLFLGTHPRRQRKQKKSHVVLLQGKTQKKRWQPPALHRNNCFFLGIKINATEINFCYRMQ